MSIITSLFPFAIGHWHDDWIAGFVFLYDYNYFDEHVRSLAYLLEM